MGELSQMVLGIKRHVEVQKRFSFEDNLETPFLALVSTFISKSVTRICPG